MKARFLKGVFVFSCTMFPVVFRVPNMASVIGMITAFGLMFRLTFRRNLLETVFIDFNKRYGLAAAVLTLTAVSFWCSFFSVLTMAKFTAACPQLETLNRFLKIVLWAAACLPNIVTAPAVFVFFYVFLRRFCSFVMDAVKESNRVERAYFIIAFLIASVAVPVVFNKTNVFYEGARNGEMVKCDVIYTADSGACYASNVHRNICAFGNDLRQPLFAVFAMPFAFLATLLSTVLFFLPNGYAVFLCLVQIALLLFTVVLISRLFFRCLPSGDSGTEIFFLTAFSLTYPFLLFALMLEQYIFAVFWLTVFLYCRICEKPEQESAFLAAAGSLTASWVLLPFAAFSKNLSGLFRNCFRIGTAFLILVFIAGQFNQLFDLQFLMFIGVKETFAARFFQFINFVALCFSAPETVITAAPPLLLPYMPVSDAFISWQLAPVTALNIQGLVLIIIAAIGFLLNRKEPFARLCFFWILFSFFLLCIIGWGAAENGMILYTLYFGWAYFCLILLAVEKIAALLPPPVCKLKYIIYIAVIITLAVINLSGIYELIQFGIEYYPSNMLWFTK